MSVNFLYVFTWAEVPNARSLVPTAAPKNALVSRVPKCLIDGKFVLKWSNWSSRQFISLPQLCLSIKWARQDCLFVDVTPFYRKDFAIVTLNLCNRRLCWINAIPKLHKPLAASWKNLVLICFVKARIKDKVLSWKLPEYLYAHRVDLEKTLANHFAYI